MPDAGPRPVDLAAWDGLIPDVHGHLSVPFDVLATLVACARALREVYTDVEAGALVRNVEHDGEPGWSLRAARVVLHLSNANAALAAVIDTAAPGAGGSG